LVVISQGTVYYSAIRESLPMLLCASAHVNVLLVLEIIPLANVWALALTISLPSRILSLPFVCLSAPQTTMQIM
jgi:hypothetical protein